MAEQKSIWPIIIEYPGAVGVMSVEPGKKQVVFSRYELPVDKFFKIIKTDASYDECAAVLGRNPHAGECLEVTMEGKRL